MLSISVIRTDRSFVRPSGRAGTAQHREPYDANWYWCARKCMHNWYHGLSMLDADLYAASNKLLLRPQFQENQGQRVRYFSRKPITIHINTVTQFIHSLHLYETAALSFRQTCLLLPRCRGGICRTGKYGTKLPYFLVLHIPPLHFRWSRIFQSCIFSR